MRHAQIWALPALFALLTACGQADDNERLARLGLPPASYQANADNGATVYGAQCRACHGPAGRGTDQGPPLVHGYYVPGHHADLAFYRAVKQGVVQHHWEFGDMPAQPQIPPTEVADVVAYVRGLQQRQGLR
jgi:mono/diheme cytochrome c family protein